MSNDKKYMRKYMLKRYHRRMNQARKELGGACSECGSVEELQFHHKDPQTKEFNLGKEAAGVSEKRFQFELTKCVLLCKSCHEYIHHTAKREHGTLSSLRYCKCDECRKAKSDYNRKWKQDKKSSLLSR